MNSYARFAIVSLLKGIFYKDDHENAFFELCGNSYGVIKEYFEVIGLDVIVDENEGFAYLKNLEFEEDEVLLPKLIQKRELGYKVSLLSVFLRKRLIDFEMKSDDLKAVVSKSDLIEQMQLFSKGRFDEIKQVGEIESAIKKVEEMGFLQKLKGNEERYEIKRAIKAFINPEWLNEFDARLREHQEGL